MPETPADLSALFAEPTVIGAEELSELPQDVVLDLEDILTRFKAAIEDLNTRVSALEQNREGRRKQVVLPRG